MIYELTKYELEWFRDNEDPENLESVTEFFANGGFDNVTTEDLKEVYKLKIGGETPCK
jgi:hypothetical protein